MSVKRNKYNLLARTISNTATNTWRRNARSNSWRTYACIMPMPPGRHVSAFHSLLPATWRKCCVSELLMSAASESCRTAHSRTSFGHSCVANSASSVGDAAVSRQSYEAAQHTDARRTKSRRKHCQQLLSRPHGTQQLCERDVIQRTAVVLVVEQRARDVVAIAGETLEAEAGLPAGDARQALHMVRVVLLTPDTKPRGQNAAGSLALVLPRRMVLRRIGCGVRSQAVSAPKNMKGRATAVPGKAGTRRPLATTSAMPSSSCARFMAAVRTPSSRSRGLLGARKDQSTSGPAMHQP